MTDAHRLLGPAEPAAKFAGDKLFEVRDQCARGNASITGDAREVVVQPLVTTTSRSAAKSLGISTCDDPFQVVAASQLARVTKEGVTVEEAVDELLTMPSGLTLTEAVELDGLGSTRQTLLGVGSSACELIVTDARCPANPRRLTDVVNGLGTLIVPVEVVAHR